MFLLVNLGFFGSNLHSRLPKLRTFEALEAFCKYLSASIMRPFETFRKDPFDANENQKEKSVHEMPFSKSDIWKSDVDCRSLQRTRYTAL